MIKSGYNNPSKSVLSHLKHVLDTQFVFLLTANPTLKDYSGVDLHTTSVKYVLYRHVLICLINTCIFIVRVFKTRESKCTSRIKINMSTEKLV